MTRLPIPILVALGLLVPVARVIAWTISRVLGTESFEGMVVPRGSVSDEASAARTRLKAALELLASRSPRTLARLRSGSRYILLAPAGRIVAFDPASRTVMLNQARVARHDAERVAVIIGVAAAMSRFRFAHFRASADVRSQMRRRIRLEGYTLMDDLNASYPTREWFGQWIRSIPESPLEQEKAAEDNILANRGPRWFLRVRRFLWN